MSKGKIIFFTAPSGSGKTTIVKHLLKQNKNLSFSVSATTRKKRPHEQDGVDYHFLDVTNFRQKIENDEFVEYEEVYDGLYYGTLKSEIERIWATGKHVIIDIEVKGALNIKKCYNDRALGVFIQLKDIETLEQRLRARGTENEERLKERLARAAYELTFANKFDKILVNAELSKALEEAQLLLTDFLGQTASIQ
ncbi:MAG: guanylate kinase [Flammeovirgaceae bacterium]